MKTRIFNQLYYTRDNNHRHLNVRLAEFLRIVHIYATVLGELMTSGANTTRIPLQIYFKLRT